MKNCKMNTKVNAIIKKVEEVQTQTVDILGALKSWKSHPNECAQTDRIIKKALDDIGNLWKNASKLRELADDAERFHTQILVGMVADQLSNRPISRKNYMK